MVVARSQPTLPIEVLPRKPQIISHSLVNYLRLTKRGVSSLPDNLTIGVNHPLRRTQVIILVIIHLPILALEQGIGHPGANNVAIASSLFFIVDLEEEGVLILPIPRSVIEEKNPSLEDKDQIAKAVGTGAVIFGALSNNKIKDIVFSYDKVLSFEGETCPYVQYTVARANSVIKKCGEIKAFDLPEITADEYGVLVELARFPEVWKKRGY